MGGESHVNKDRERGVRSFLNDKNYFMDLKVIYGLSTIDSVYSYAMQHLTTQNYPDIIFVSGDEKVQGLIRACYEKGILIQMIFLSLDLIIFLFLSIILQLCLQLLPIMLNWLKK